jgi:hypothetical protein
VAVVEAVQADNQDMVEKILPAAMVQLHHLMVENTAVVVEVEETLEDEVVMAVTE